MILKRSVLILVVLSACLICPSESSSASDRSECRDASAPSVASMIVGVEVAARDKWPWLVALFDKADNKFICAGSLISERFVLTAAHCIFNKEKDEEPREPKDVNVFLGRWNLSDATEQDVVLATPEKFIVHGDWNVTDTNWDADIAIARLADSVTFSRSVQPVCLWTSQMQPDEANDGGMVVGWSKTEVNGEHSDIPEEAKVLRLPIEDCNETDGLSQTILRRGLCARGSQEGACSGNDGGEFFTARGVKWILRGITSVSRLNVATKCDAIFTNIEEFIPWIDHVLDGDEQIQCTFTGTIYGYTCMLANSFTSKDTKIFHVSGSHHGGQTNADVRRFYAWYKELKFLPITFGRVFPNLKSYVVRESGLEQISRNNFVGLPELEELWIAQNPLKDIPEDSFYDLSNLQWLYLQSNQIKAIDSDTFIHNTKLRFIDLEHNKITSLDSATFKKNFRLESIDFSYNLLTSIGPELLTRLGQLSDANFKNNKCIDKEWRGSLYYKKEEIKEDFKSKCQQGFFSFFF